MAREVLNMSEGSSTSGGGIGLGGVLLILFIALKLTGHINWSWWWVLAPAWIPLGIVAIAIGAVAIAFGITAITK